MTVYSLQSNLSIDWCLASGHLPDANQAVSVTSEEGVAISSPCERNAGCWQCLGLGVGHGELELELIHDALALEVPDADANVGGSAQPVAVGREAQSMDDITLLARQRVETLALLRSHSIATPSLPPDAHREPSGDTVTALM